MALYIGDNDNNKTFVGHSARAQMMLLGPQINNMPSKSLVIVLINPSFQIKKQNSGISKSRNDFSENSSFIF